LEGEIPEGGLSVGEVQKKGEGFGKKASPRCGKKKELLGQREVEIAENSDWGAGGKSAATIRTGWKGKS